MDTENELTEGTIRACAYLAAMDDWVYEDPVTNLTTDDPTIEQEDVAIPTVDQGGGAIVDEPIAPYDLDENVHIECTGHRMSPKYRLHFKCYSVKVSDLESVAFVDVPLVISLILEHILQTILCTVGEKEMVRLRIESRHLERPIWTPAMRKSQLDIQRWMNEIEKVLNSNEEFVLDDTFEISVQYTDLPSGSCRRLVPELLRKRLKKMRSVVAVNNTDEICMARALVMGKAYADTDKNMQRKLKRGTKLHTTEAKNLVRRSGLPERAFDITDIPRFEAVLSDYQIIVVGLEQGCKIVYGGKHRDKHIVLLHHGHHFDVLTSLPAFFKRSYWCYHCNKGFNKRLSHRCANICNQCLRSNCERDKSKPIRCDDCCRSFFGPGCFAEHKLSTKKDKFNRNKTRRSLCSLVYICQECQCMVSLKNRKDFNKHVCGEVYCKNCNVHAIPEEHKCYMKPHVTNAEELRLNDHASFLYFDFETYVSNSGELVPNLAVVQNDKGDEWIFPAKHDRIGVDVTEQLCKFLFSPDHKDYFIIAHNFKSFDGYFILHWLLKNGVTPKVIMNGGKILQLDVPGLNIRFRDSMNYNPQSLAKWPATLGLPQIGKGSFPHKFNRCENWNKVVPFPTIQEYGFDTMDKKAQISFKQWYDSEFQAKNGQFNFRKEFVSYCQNDVTVLRLCCQEFSKLFKEIGAGINPFVSALTIAGVCNLYWRWNILMPYQIGLVPQQRFSRNRLQSAKAMKWLSWMEESDNCVIQSVVNGNEYKVGPYFVDGFCTETERVYEFYGCWFHGCPVCTDPDTIHPFRNLTMKQIYQETQNREEYVRSQGHPLNIIWEHDFDLLVRENEEMRKYIKELTITEPLNPRNAFYGGRTNATKLHHKCQGDEKIFYYDVNSEYPYVNKNKRYPVDHPTIITNNFKDAREYFGLIHCTVSPPNNLFLPILPYRSNGKLTFPLCRTCVNNYQQTVCMHSERERSLTGTWPTPEIHCAMDHGYKILKIFEVWHYQKYEDHLFQKYINNFLKIKTEATGWPVGVTTEVEKQKYIAEYKEREGVVLQYDKIKPNPGLRSLAKLCLNSFWGRLGMQDNKLNTMYINEPEKFYEMLFSGKYHVHSWDLFNEDVVQITYTKEDGFVDSNPKTNVVLAAFTTCWARLHLYQFMDMVKDRLLYFDTDSILFIGRPGVPNPPTGAFLGDLTNELKPEQHIVQFVSLGAKTYAYVTNDEQCVVKIKGFTVNGHTKEKLNFDNMLNMLRNRTKAEIHYDDVIKRVKSSMILMHAKLKKILQVTYDKRILLEDWTTLPYGFRTQ